MKYSEVGRESGTFAKIVRRIFFAVFLFVFFCGCMYKIVTLHASADALDAKIQELEEQIEAEKEAQLDLKASQKYYESDAYKEELARDRFGLVYPGEILVIVD